MLVDEDLTSMYGLTQIDHYLFKHDQQLGNIFTKASLMISPTSPLVKRTPGCKNLPRGGVWDWNTCTDEDLSDFMGILASNSMVKILFPFPLTKFNLL